MELAGIGVDSEQLQALSVEFVGGQRFGQFSGLIEAPLAPSLL